MSSLGRAFAAAADWAICLLLLFAGMVCGILVSQSYIIQRWQQEAVKHDAAVWHCDQTTGAVTFIWKDELNKDR